MIELEEAEGEEWRVEVERRKEGDREEAGENESVAWGEEERRARRRKRGKV